jgi:hypothetical protein
MKVVLPPPLKLTESLQAGKSKETTSKRDFNNNPLKLVQEG